MGYELPEELYDHVEALPRMESLETVPVGISDTSLYEGLATLVEGLHNDARLYNAVKDKGFSQERPIILSSILQTATEYDVVGFFPTEEGLEYAAYIGHWEEIDTPHRLEYSRPLSDPHAVVHALYNTLNHRNEMSRRVSGNREPMYFDANTVLSIFKENLMEL